MDHSSSLPRSEIDLLGTIIAQSGDPFPLTSTEQKEKEIIHTNRVKLTDYIHDVTMLFPYLKERHIFSVYDCDVIKGESAAYNKVDKFIDVLFTKGPKAIGAFHEALAKTYPGLFDYLTRLFTGAGIDLPESRRMRPASDIDVRAIDGSVEEDHRNSIDEDPESNSYVQGMRVLSRRGMTVRRSLDILSKQLENIQKERNELKNTLFQREREISDLLRSKDKSHDDLLSITQHYQDLYKELLQMRDSLSVGEAQRLQELLVERESIQAEYDALENDYTLAQLELRAARERIGRIMRHLERSEQLVALKQEEKDVLQNKIDQLEGELQRAERKHQRLPKIDVSGGSKSEIESLTKQMEKLEKKLEESNNEAVELTERIRVARHERGQALAEKEDIIQKHYFEEQKRKKAEHEVKQLHRRIQQMKDHDSHSSDSSFFPYSMYAETKMSIEMEDFTTVMQVSKEMGMKVGLGVIVTEVKRGGVAAKCGLKNGDQIFQVNHIDVTTDRDPLDLCNRLLHNASSLVTILIRRPVLVNKQATIQCLKVPQVHSMPSKIRQAPVNSISDASTIDKFALPICHTTSSMWETSPEYLNEESSGYHVTTPTSDFTTTPSSGKGVIVTLGEHTSSSNSNTNSTTELKSDGEKGYGHELSREDRRKKLIKAPLVSSDDGHSSKTSSSDGYNSDHGFESSGFVTSVYRSKNYDDIPDTVTRPPTIVGFDDDDDISLDRLDTFINDYHVHTPQNNSMERPKYLQLQSSPAPSSNTSSLIDSPNMLRRAKAKKWIQYGQRRSQSLVDIPDLEDLNSQATDVIKTPHLRRVVLPWGRLGEGIILVGGRGRGVFIHSKKNDSRGLQSGDQIVMIGSDLTTNMTHAEVVTTIDKCSQRGEQCIVSVQSNLEGFMELPSLDAKDNFYVKTLFSHIQSIHGELTFNRDEVFNVYDTLPSDLYNVWKVKRINNHGQVEDVGLIPLEQKLSDWTSSAPSSLPSSGFKFPFVGRRFNSQSGSKTMEVIPDQSLHGRALYDLYQPVRRIAIKFPRPVVLFGVCESEVTTALLGEVKFSLPPIRTLGSLAMVEDQCCDNHVILKRTGENIRYCKVMDIVSIAQQDQHCVLPIEPSQLKNRSALDKLHPIVLFLHTTKTGTLFKLKVFRCTSEVVTKYIQDMKTVEEEYYSYFTGRVEISGGLDNIVRQVKAEILIQQKMALWEDDTIEL